MTKKTNDLISLLENLAEFQTQETLLLLSGTELAAVKSALKKASAALDVLTETAITSCEYSQELVNTQLSAATKIRG